MNLTIKDQVKTPDGRSGQIAEFNQDGNSGKIAKVWVTDHRGIVLTKWYLTSELKPA
jgi:hypothetical protein